MPDTEKEQTELTEEETEIIEAKPIEEWPEDAPETEPEPVQKQEEEKIIAQVKKQKKEHAPAKKTLSIKKTIKAKPKFQKQTTESEVKMKKHTKKEKKSSKKKFAIKTAHVILIIVALIIAIVAVSFLVGKLPGQKTKDAVLVKVNNESITKLQLEKRMAQVPTQMQAQVTQEIMLSSMIEEMLLYQEAEKQGIVITDADVDAYLAARLAAIGMTQEQLNKQLTETNMTLPELQQSIKRELAISTLINQTILQQTSITDADVRTYYDANTAQFTTPAQVNAQQIRICFKGAAQCITNRTMDEAGALVGVIMQKIKAGADFTDLVLQYTDDETAKNSKGYTGLFSQDELTSPFEDYGKLAFSLNINETAFTKVSFGYFIIKTVDKQDQKTTTFDEAKDSIKAALLNYKQSSAYTTYMAKLWNNAEIIVVTPLKSAAAQAKQASSGLISESTTPQSSGPAVQSISVE